MVVGASVARFGGSVNDKGLRTPGREAGGPSSTRGNIGVSYCSQILAEIHINDGDPPKPIITKTQGNQCSTLAGHSQRM